MDCSLPGSSVHWIHQARILEWVAIPFSRGSSWPRDQTWVSCIAGRFFTIWATREALDRFSSVQSLSRVRHFVTPWTAACQASLSITNSQSLLKLMFIESLMPSIHLILCRPLLRLPSIFPSTKVFSNELVLHRILSLSKNDGDTQATSSEILPLGSASCRRCGISLCVRFSLSLRNTHPPYNSLMPCSLSLAERAEPPHSVGGRVSTTA